MAITRALSLGSVVLPGVHPKLGSFMELELPHMDGVIGIYVLGGSLESSVINRVNPTERATIIGSPQLDPSGFGIICNWANCLDIGKQATPDRTWYAISRPRTAADPGNAALANTIVSNKNFVGSPSRQTGDQLFWHQTPAINNVAENATAVNTNSAPASGYDADKWAAAVGYVDTVAGVNRAGSRQGGGPMRWSFTPGGLTIPRATDGSGRTIRVGALATNSDVGERGDAHVGIFINVNRTHSESIIEDNVNYVGNVWLPTAFSITDV
ncbi:hypothetical protein [Stenotrophomonas tumulicola]|uniref:Uncharacterized protein n=1 Tax=Stenotrophomonas tumulicola TaxID=1685415 RepID=A0A7W3IG82_9GAMM|nr:hypothetical protein [Stenotrophomonas tumulicola]MBA8680527.1 hypothetical protein [Stenotrophomonas tumulicola]